MAANKEQQMLYLEKIAKTWKVTVEEYQAIWERVHPKKKTISAEDLFETKSYFENLAPMKWLIELIAHEEEISWVGALPKHMKTWFLLCVVNALLTGEPLFGDPRFKVAHISKRILYLIPEVSSRSFFRRLKSMGLDVFLYDPKTNPEGCLLVRTLSKGECLQLLDPALLSFAEGADIFLDTAVRWLSGDENKSTEVKVLTTNIMNLISHKARSVWCAHHAAKGFESADSMSLQNMFRGSNEYGAALSNAYGLCKLDKESALVHVSCLDGRDLESHVPDFHIMPTRNESKQITGFYVSNPNAGSLANHKPKKKRGRRAASSDAWKAIAIELAGQGYGRDKISEALVERGHKDATPARVRTVLEQHDEEKAEARETVEAMQEQGKFNVGYQKSNPEPQESGAVPF